MFCAWPHFFQTKKGQSFSCTFPRKKIAQSFFVANFARKTVQPFVFYAFCDFGDPKNGGGGSQLALKFFNQRCTSVFPMVSSPFPLKFGAMMAKMSLKLGKSSFLKRKIKPNDPLFWIQHPQKPVSGTFFGPPTPG
jgi:hypothetical protein